MTTSPRLPDVAATKPEPDLVLAALGARYPACALMIGDTTWDCIAAKRAGLPAVAVLTGFRGCELIAAGAAAVAPSVDDLSLNPSLRQRREGPEARDRREEALSPGPAGR